MDRRLNGQDRFSLVRAQRLASMLILSKACSFIFYTFTWV